MSSRVRLAVVLTIAAMWAAAQAAPPVRAVTHARPAGGGGQAATNDRELEAAIRARFAKSKIGTNHFTVHVQGGVATIEGHADVIQHKGTATRLAKAAGAREVVNRVELSEAAKERAAANLATGRRRAQVKRGDKRSSAMQRLRPVASTVSKIGPTPVRRWVVPYVDQPLAFWERLDAEFGPHIREVYFPLHPEVVGSGRPAQATEHLASFLKRSRLPRAVLVNPMTLARPVEEIAPATIEALKRLMGEFGIASATVANLLLAARIREALPELPLAASVLMDIAQPNQALMLKGICDTLVPSSRILRDLPALQALRAAFAGRIRLIVNEACLPGCPYRVQHFHEMSAGFARPGSLCGELLEREPWMRLAGAWVLPQHLHLLDGVADDWKLAGRVTLRDAATYRKVLGAYVHRRALGPHEIGGGPASPLEPVEIAEEFYARTLRCGRRCHECTICREYYDEAQRTAGRSPGSVRDSTRPVGLEA